VLPQASYNNVLLYALLFVVLLYTPRGSGADCCLVAPFCGLKSISIWGLRQGCCGNMMGT